MTLRKHIKAAAGDLLAASVSFRGEHGRTPDRQDWQRAGVKEPPAELIGKPGGRRPSTPEGRLVPVSVKLRPSVAARLASVYGTPAAGLRALAEDAAQLLTPEQAERAARAASVLGVEEVAEAIR